MCAVGERREPVGRWMENFILQRMPVCVFYVRRYICAVLIRHIYIDEHKINLRKILRIRLEKGNGRRWKTSLGGR